MAGGFSGDLFDAPPGPGQAASDPGATGHTATAASDHGASAHTNTPRVITLDSQVDLAGFRRHARELLREQIPPEAVSWQVRDVATSDLFTQVMPEDDGAAVNAVSGAATVSPHTRQPASNDAPALDIRVPADFLTLCKTAILHSAPQRFGVLYRLLWRLVRQPDLRHDTLDPDRVYLENLARVVRRDKHKMTAFVRFRTVHDDTSDQPLHVAWFEPDHHIVEATAPFFQRRFAQMRWAIMTPERSVQWDGKALSFGPGMRRDQAPPADAGEALWLTYYENIFNPSRLKVQAMKNEMPRRYWHNLPEAVLIEPLVAEASRRSAGMIAQAPTAPRKPRPVVTMTHAPRDGAAMPSRGMSLPELHNAAQRCRACPIGHSATQVVFGEGRTPARLMVVGEQPGDYEDLQGRPFVGPSGQLFERALTQLGWSRDALYVTNAVKHFKFELRGKRRIHKTPAQAEADACLQWLESEIDLVKPQAIIALGATAARSLMRHPVAVTRERGQWLQRADTRPVLITLHPSALLRMQDGDKDAAFRQWLDDLAAATPYAMSPGDAELVP
ncbi:UdgX family uracil-DNA binding protein [Pigmentiphaga litoralis]|uniref:Type-4 uracil-DNA glycosylase n=1 Tax=Pigmentiphaga litoralis TaxID=516702 RepID=A0A7Y9IQJ8_9BURK|nr:UdgX family uracil-DNA binding protein [Pigmentiphaga litoralis]NYE25260.1 DNA polymerase [Pigmentiphaga litoralis]NYE81127.1 DNA polymerase [Pigmentiphaga litoralis]